MPYRIAGIDVHKKMLAVVVSNVEVESEFQFERRMAETASPTLFRKERVERELDDELRGFLEMAAEEKMKQGTSAQPAGNLFWRHVGRTCTLDCACCARALVLRSRPLSQLR